MCTVSWILHEDGFELFCNRDETRRRAVALPPRPSERDGVAYLAPRDGDAGGTWIAVNELALALCLVNRYPDPEGGAFVSRGHLVLELADARSADEVAERLQRLEDGGAPRYRPFRLLTFEPGAPPLAAAWDGERLLPPDPEPVAPPISSSSYDPAGIGAVRRRLWQEELGRELAGRPPTAGDLLRFHRSHLPARGPLSPCMHRDDARTVSLTRVRVTPATVEMAYAGGPPCEVELPRPLILRRRRSRSRDSRRLAPVV